MSQYIVTTHNPEKDFSTGLVLGIEEAPHPEDAINQIANKVIDDEFIELAKEDNLTFKSKVNLALWILEQAAGEDIYVKIYEVADNAVGDPNVVTVDELNFQHPQPP